MTGELYKYVVKAGKKLKVVERAAENGHDLNAPVPYGRRNTALYQCPHCFRAVIVAPGTWEGDPMRAYGSALTHPCKEG
jgi:hypothetical protein